jgi:Leucine-rich repeat (LRR) protein
VTRRQAVHLRRHRRRIGERNAKNIPAPTTCRVRFVLTDSPRRVSPSVVRGLVEEVPAGVLTVAVFTDEPLDQVRRDALAAGAARGASCGVRRGPADPGLAGARLRADRRDSWAEQEGERVDQVRNLWRQDLGEVPESVWDLTGLRVLILADNGLTAISPSIGRLRLLRTLDLGHNALTTVPGTLGELSGLTDFLYLHDNRLTELPTSLGRLTRLRHLNVSENGLAELPENVGDLGGLVELRCQHNHLSGLPHSLGRLVQLRELWLRGNALVGLSPASPLPPHATPYVIDSPGQSKPHPLRGPGWGSS